MTKEQEKAITRLEKLKNSNILYGDSLGITIEGFKSLQKDLEVVLNTINEKDAEIEKLKRDFKIVDEECSRLKRKEIVKHSFNIAELIKVNDFVNGHRVANIKNDEGRIEIGLETDHMINYYIEKEDIKTILTYEQHERNFYRLD